MSRKLNALLFELQTAQTPLARAKVLARSWRTLRELSPTDRRLLARQAGFDGAEELLEGLASRRGSWGPAMMLELLGKARSADASAVNEIIRGLQTPGQRKDALRRGADFAAELLAEPAADEAETGADEEESKDEKAEVETVEVEEPPETEDEMTVAPTAADARPAPAPPVRQEAEPEPKPEPEPRLQLPPAPAPRKPPAVDWSRWDQASPPAPLDAAADRPTLRESSFPQPPAAPPASPVAGETRKSTLALLSDIRRGLPDLRGADVDALREVLEELPEGWPRRRALTALLEEGVPANTRDALELIGGLERERDRRWCLGLLAHRGDLAGADLERALELLSSPSARRRIVRACVS